MGATRATRKHPSESPVTTWEPLQHLGDVCEIAQGGAMDIGSCPVGAPITPWGLLGLLRDVLRDLPWSPKGYYGDWETCCGICHAP